MAFFAGIKSLGARLGAHDGSHEHGMSMCAMSLRMILCLVARLQLLRRCIQ